MVGELVAEEAVMEKPVAEEAVVGETVVEENEHKVETKKLLEELGMVGIIGADVLDEGDSWECQACAKNFETQRGLYFHN